MFSQAELVQATRRRQQVAGHRLRLVAEAWRQWLAALPPLAPGPRGLDADELIRLLGARPLRPPPPASAQLSAWQGLRAVFRQSLDPPGAHDVRERRIAWSVSVGTHVLLFVALLWLAGHPPPPGPSRQGEDVLQVRYVGIRTPDAADAEPADAKPQPEQRVEPVQAAAAAPAAAAADAQPVPTPQREQMAVTTSQPQLEVVDLMQPPRISEPTEISQPLQVTEVEQADTEFVVPPATAPQRAQPSPQVRPGERAVAQRDVQLAERSELPSISVPPTRPQLRTTQLSAATQSVRERQVEVGSQPQAPSLRTPSPQAGSGEVRVQRPAVQLRGREVELAGEALRASQAAAAAAAGNQGGEQTRPPSGSGSSSAAAAGSSRQPATGGGQASAAASGWPPSRAGDDWGDSDRAQAGGKAGSRDGRSDGLFTADGRPRVPPGVADAGGGLPPGADGWSRELLDRHGTWLSRPPNDYNPTRFDQYWMPTATLLEEWVRRGVRNLEIPVPGSSKRIVCVISMLQLGGGCGVVDPNLQDQPATARPAPEVPWKPELQED